MLISIPRYTHVFCFTVLWFTLKNTEFQYTIPTDVTDVFVSNWRYPTSKVLGLAYEVEIAPIIDCPGFLPSTKKKNWNRTLNVTPQFAQSRNLYDVCPLGVL